MKWEPKYTIDEIQTAVDIVIGDDGFSGKQVVKTVKLIHLQILAAKRGDKKMMLNDKI
jgi:hypothetical protein